MKYLCLLPSKYVNEIFDWLENTLEHILFTILWLNSLLNVITALETIFYMILGLQSILNVFSLLKPVFLSYFWAKHYF